MLIQMESDISVVEAARARIKNSFKGGRKHCFFFSGGKDSIVCAFFILEALKKKYLKPEKLTVIFVDEEGVFPSVVKNVEKWREIFLEAGANFIWYAMEYKHFNCLNQLENDETFICFDERKKDVWIREKPKFSMKAHRDLKPRKDSYLNFLERAHYGSSVPIIGLRAYESVQRMVAIGKIKDHDKLYPIYDWKDNDIWLFIKEKNLDIPEAYLQLYQTGARKMRLSQFFSIDTIPFIAKMKEYDNELYKKVLAREPNAYIVSLYWGSEMFRRVKNSEKKAVSREECVDLIKSKIAEKGMEGSNNYLKVLLNLVMLESRKIEDKGLWYDVYKIAKAGDPKSRSVRAFFSKVHG